MTFLERILTKILPYTDITKWVMGPSGVPEEVVYLRRFFVFRSRHWGSIYLHHILRSDDDPDPHDHPWDFRTFILSGSYLDEAHQWVPAEVQTGKCMVETMVNTLKAIEAGHRDGPHYSECLPFHSYSRKAEHLHRVRLPGEFEGKPQPVWTLVFTGPVRRQWNFVTIDGPVPWRKYLGLSEEDPYAADH